MPSFNVRPRERAALLTLMAVAVVALVGGCATPAVAGQPTVLPFRVDRNVRIPMRDGITLGALVYRPASSDVRVPVIATLTPYMADRFHDIASYFAQRGYVVALIDCRGRGDSGGEFDPWMADANDFYDALEWLASRPYADGQIATWGGSYGGKNQWAAAGLRPRSLRTIAPAASGFVGFDMGMRRNVPFSFMQRWLTLVSGKAGNRRLFEDVDYWNAVYAEISRGEVPWRGLDQLSGNPSPIWQRWVDHPMSDAFWDAASATDEQFAKIEIPVLSITGMYDDAQIGTLEFRARHHRSASGATLARHYTVIGPWDHGGTRAPRAQLGGLDFGPDSLVDMTKLHLEWYDWIMKGGKRPAFLQDRFAYFVTGTNRWAYASDLEAATARSEVLSLSSLKTRADSVVQRGQLLKKAVAQESDSYIYDPGLPAHNEGVEGEDSVSASYLTDDRSVTRLNGDGLVYDTDVYAAGTEVAGRPTVRLSLSMDVPDTDIRVQLFEVRQDGTSVFLGHDWIRARYRQDARQARLVTPGMVEPYVFDQLPFIARTLSLGSRLRLVISPLGASIHQQRNRNSGGVVADETARDNRVARVAVALGPGLSTLSIPYGR
jgi:putative CocE/NonD family hydrolase